MFRTTSIKGETGDVAYLVLANTFFLLDSTSTSIQKSPSFYGSTIKKDIINS